MDSSRTPPLEMERVSELKILGVLFTNDLSVTSHVDDIISKCASSTYALRILRANGLLDNALFTVCNATTISRLLYLAQAWWVCSSAADKERVNRFLRKLYRAGYSHKVNFDDLIKPAEKKLLCKVKNNECHVLRPLFPPLAQRSHSLRPRAHDFVLPCKDDKKTTSLEFFTDSATAYM